MCSALMRLPLFMRLAALALSIAASESALLSGKRPILTGCLQECGNKDTQCVTECQVCVEKSSCESLEKCKACQKEVRKAMRSDARAPHSMTDSGGESLLHDGIRQKVENARFDLKEQQEKLLAARGAVVAAQHTVEHMSGERQEKAHELRLARSKRSDAEERVLKWDKANDHKLSKAENRLRAAQAEASREEMKLREAKEELRQARARVKEVKEDIKDDDKDDETHAKKLKRAEDKEWKVRRRIEKLKDEVEEAEKEVKKRRKEAAWVNRQLRKDVDYTVGEIKDAERALQEARVRETVAQSDLTASAKAYKKEIARSQAAQDRVHRYEKDLQKHPLPESLEPPPSAFMGAHAEESRAHPRLIPLVTVAAALTAFMALDF